MDRQEISMTYNASTKEHEARFVLPGDGRRTVGNVEMMLIPKTLYDEWVAANDAALDWADANARAFPIETAPDDTLIMVWEADEQEWFIPVAKDWKTRYNIRAFTHWAPLPPPPSNPPLPEPIEALGAVLRRVKGCE